MVFDFYGPDVNQMEIADVARTAPAPYGTYTPDMVRAAHFSNISTSVGREVSINITGYAARQTGYAAFERGGMTIDDLKSLTASGYPIIALGGWHFRVVVGYNSTHIITQDPLYGECSMTHDEFNSDWDYSAHWGLFVSPWNVEISAKRNVLPNEVFNVTATIAYPCPAQFFSGQYVATMANATIALPPGLVLDSNETLKKPIATGDLAPGASANVTWRVKAESVGHYNIFVETEGKIDGYVPDIPNYPQYNYEDRIGGSNQSVVAVTPTPDETPPTTNDNYDDLWRNQTFAINLTAILTAVSWKPTIESMMTQQKP